jgi:UDP-glucose 4-epimerase
MKVLVTGAGGRIGTHLSRSLLTGGHEVRAFGLAGDPRLAALAERGAEVILGDLEVQESLRDAVRGVDAVCHLAAALTTHDVADGRYVDVNLRGTFNLLEVVRELAPDLQRFVYTSSDAVYWGGGDAHASYLPVDEAHALRPGSVYGATKMGAEELCRSFWRTYGIPFTVMRPTATADPGELIRPDSVFGRRWFLQAAIAWYAGRSPLRSPDRSLLDALRSADDGTDKLYALVDVDGTSSLSMLGDARDAAAGMNAMLEPPEAVGEAFNIGPGAPHADRELVHHLGERLGQDVVEIRHPSVRPSWHISSAKARGVLGFRPSRTVFEMVDEAVDHAVARRGTSS